MQTLLSFIVVMTVVLLVCLVILQQIREMTRGPTKEFIFKVIDVILIVTIILCIATVIVMFYSI